MEIKREDILHLSDLSDFSLSENEIEKLGGDLEGIIKYISQLDELDTNNVEPTYQVFGVMTRFCHKTQLAKSYLL